MSDDLPQKVSTKPKRFTRLRKLTGWRKVAVGMWGSPDSPAVYGQRKLDVTKVRELVKKLRDERDIRISPLHVVVKALAHMFQEYPHYNVMLRRNRFFQRPTADIFIQVAIKEGAGDLGGVKVRAVNTKTIVDLANEIASRAARVRAHDDPEMETAKKSLRGIPPLLMPAAVKFSDFLSNGLWISLPRLGIRPDPFGAAMVTNLGSFGLPHGYAPLIPASRTPIIFALGAIKDEVVAVDGEVVIKPMMTITGTFDHRIFDGMQLAKLTQHVCERFENPEWLLDELDPETGEE